MTFEKADQTNTGALNLERVPCLKQKLETFCNCDPLGQKPSKAGSQLRQAFLPIYAGTHTRVCIPVPGYGYPGSQYPGTGGAKTYGLGMYLIELLVCSAQLLNKIQQHCSFIKFGPAITVKTLILV